jgi:hypothetical protein
MPGCQRPSLGGRGRQTCSGSLPRRLFGSLDSDNLHRLPSEGIYGGFSDLPITLAGMVYKMAGACFIATVAAVVLHDVTPCNHRGVSSVVV